MLFLKNITAGAGQKTILNKLTLTIKKGEVHILMGPNASGKSTLANVLMRNPTYQVKSGKIIFCNKNLLKFTTDKVARLGLFLAFQNPQSIPGLTNAGFLHLLRNMNGPRKKTTALKSLEKELFSKTDELRLPKEFLNHSLNENLSGGEKKKSEVLQSQLLKLKLAIYDEIDSGLDIDALKLVCQQIKKLQKNHTSLLFITHYNRIIKYLKPDFVHIMYQGQIVKSGDRTLAEKIEKAGYEKLFGFPKLNTSAKNFFSRA